MLLGSLQQRFRTVTVGVLTQNMFTTCMSDPFSDVVMTEVIAQLVEKFFRIVVACVMDSFLNQFLLTILSEIVCDQQ